jgi:hypothetical protein
MFILAMDWLMRETTKDKRREIQWTLTSVIEDLDFADDIGLLSNRHQDIQEKIQRLSDTASSIGLNINSGKTKYLKNNTTVNNPVKISNQEVEKVTEFNYLGSKVTADCDSERDVDARLAKANQAFATKIRLFKSNVLCVLLYSSECWKMTTGNLTRSKQNA